MPRIERFGLTEGQKPNRFHKAVFSPDYWYYDTPDGQDCLKKWWWMTKFSTALGVHLGICDCLLRSPFPSDPFATLSRVARIAFPLVAVASVYATVTCSVSSIRGKDDFFNQISGTTASAFVVSRYCKAPVTAVQYWFFVSIFACAKKYANDRGINLFFRSSSPPKLLAPTTYPFHDYTILKDDKPHPY